MLIATGSFFLSFGQNNFFSDVSERSIELNGARRVIVPQKFRAVALDQTGLKQFLWSLPSERNVHNRNTAPVLELPMPDGRISRFRVWESSIQEPALEARFPDIKTFTGQGIDDPYATIRFDFTPRGFHAQVLTVNGTYYVDPYAVGITDAYISYFRTDLSKNNNFVCEVIDNPSSPSSNFTTAACRGTEMRTYRLAVACTGEYAQAPGINAGANAAVLHGAIVTSVNRVVGVYEKEVSLRMVLVANNNIVEYLDAATDPFNGNNNAGTLINESQTVIDANIGSANYDIGHTFSTGGGGLAQLRSPCGTSKARGITGSPSPTGDAYDIDYVAHEMGHQWGGNHSMAGCGSSPTNTKYEVGSGTTIQAYAGICGAQDIQPNSDPHFHAISFDEISDFLSTGAGGTCGVATPTGNTLPVIDPLTNNNVSIPPGTPFTLTGSATDANGDALTYNWEQWDFSGTANWNAGATGAVNNTLPLFKSRIPKTNGSRTFPDVAVINANYPANPAATMGGLKGETLSPVARAMKFRLTVRDNRAGGGGVVSSGSGCQGTAVFQVNVAGTTPFTVSVPNGGESYPGSTTQTVTWNVAGTDMAPVNVANVRITLSTDGGLTYPTVLLASTANDGTESVTIPNTPTSTAKVRVEAVGNIFFDVSNANFAITVPVTGFNFTAPAVTNVSCGGAAVATSNLATVSNGGFVTPINLSATAGVPAGTTVSFGTNPLVPGNSTTVNLNNANTLTPGTYDITVTGVAGANTQTQIVSFLVQPGSGPAITGQPANLTVCAGNNASFTAVSSGTYQWQLSTNGGGSWSAILGATAASYTVTSPTIAENNNQYRVIVTGQCGSTTSSAAVLTVNPATTLTAQPQNTVVCAGGSATFSSTATGTGLGYQWQLSTNAGGTWNNIVGATSASYTEPSVINGMDGYQYRVVVSGTCAPTSVISNAATLSVGNPSAFTGQPAATAVCAGQDASFMATATGSSLTYQWQQSTDGGTSWTNIAGATSATLSLTAVTVSMSGTQYRLQVFSCTPTPIISNTAILTVNTNTAINTQPSAVTLCSGSTSNFSVSAVGTGAAYQWQYAASCGGGFTNIAGATSASYSISGTAVSNAGAYQVVVTGACNTVTSNCVALVVNSPVSVTTQPANVSVCLPTNTTSISIAATGTAVTYQWQQSTDAGASWTNISGATAATLNLTGLTASMNGYRYRALLAGTCTPSLISSSAVLTVNSPVAITAQPLAVKKCVGDNHTFSVSATGSTITYQWQVSVNGGPFVNIAGATTSSLPVTGLTTAMNGNVYRVIVSGVPCGAVTSQTALLNVNTLPGAVLTLASNQAITPYMRSRLYVTVSPPNRDYSYAWTKNGFPYPSVTGNEFIVTADDFGEYNVTVTDDTTGCSITSNAARLLDLKSDQVFIYPNPTSGQFQVRYYNNAGTTERNVVVYSAKGEKVWSKMYTTTGLYERMDVDLRKNAAGVYYVVVFDRDGKRLASGPVLKR